MFCFAEQTAKEKLQQKGRICMVARAGQLRTESLWPDLHSAEPAEFDPVL